MNNLCLSSKTAFYLPMLLLLGLCGAMPVQAQRYLGAISGVVSDPSGAKIQGATVTATEASTKFSTIVTTTGAGATTGSASGRGRKSEASDFRIAAPP